MIQLGLSDEWELAYIGKTEAGQQYDDETVDIVVTGSMPSGWRWKLYLASGTQLDMIDMTQESDGLRCTLKAGHLSKSGLYNAQLYATRRNQVKHSTKALFLIGDTFSGNDKWPEVPTTFLQAVASADAARDAAGAFAADAEDSAEAAAASVGKYPRVNEAGRWEVWDPVTAQWADTGVPAQGVGGINAGFGSISATAETGDPEDEATVTVESSGPDTAKSLEFSFRIPKGEKGERGLKGDVYFAQFDINPRTGELIMYHEDEYSGPSFSLDEEGRLKVTYRSE